MSLAAALSVSDEDIESVQTVGLHCGCAGKAEESGVWGNSRHRCCRFQRQNRELRNANQPDFYRSCFPTRNTIHVNKEEEAAEILIMFNTICVECWAPNFILLINSFSLWWFLLCVLQHACQIVKSLRGLHDNARLVWRVPSKNRIHLTSKQQQRRQLHILCSVSTLCGIQAFCIWWEGLESAAVSGAQQTNSQNAFVYCHTHSTLTQGQQPSFKSDWGNVVASLSSYLIICLPKTLINGKHSVYVSEALIVSVVKAKLRVFINPRRPHGFDTGCELGSCDRRHVKPCGLTSPTNAHTTKQPWMITAGAA